MKKTFLSLLYGIIIGVTVAPSLESGVTPEQVKSMIALSPPGGPAWSGIYPPNVPGILPGILGHQQIGALNGMDPFSHRRVVDTTISSQLLNNKLLKR